MDWNTSLNLTNEQRAQVEENVRRIRETEIGMGLRFTTDAHYDRFNKDFWEKAFEDQDKQ